MKLVACTFLLILSTAFGLPEPLKPIDWDRVRPIHQLESWRKHHPVIAEHYPISSGSNQINGRIINGEIAKPNSIPYQVALIVYFSDGMSLCGGSILTKNYVLTAAHCVDIAIAVLVATGAHNIAVQESLREEYQVEPPNIILHEEWDRDQFSNDIATLKLPNSIEFAAHVASIRLPPRALHGASFALGQAVASGWGRYNNSSPDTSDYLRRVDLLIIPNVACKLSFATLLRSTNICTLGLLGPVPCNGDSGGPLVYNLSGVRMQVGIVSFGNPQGCGTIDPTVFTRVTSFAKFIEDNSDYIFD